MWDLRSKKDLSPVFPSIYKSFGIYWYLTSSYLHPLFWWTGYQPPYWVTLEGIMRYLWSFCSTNNPIFPNSKQSGICFEYLPFLPNMKEQWCCPLCIDRSLVCKWEKVKIANFTVYDFKTFIWFFFSWDDLGNKILNIPKKHWLILLFGAVNLSRFSCC